MAFCHGVTIDGARISARGVRGLTATPSETEPSSARIRLELLRPAAPSVVPFTCADAYRVGAEVWGPPSPLPSATRRP